MRWIKDTLLVETHGQGLYELTEKIQSVIAKHNVSEGQITVFIQHTSASLCITENADPTAKRDLESFLNRIAPENLSWHQHTLEGADDSPSHMKSVLTNTNETIPIDSGRMTLGTWQGLYLCEHRHAAHKRKILLRMLSAR